MINLLPGEVKTSYYYARRNVGLRRWVAAFVVAFVGMGVIATYGLLTFHQQTMHYQGLIATGQTTLEKEHFTQTQAQVKTISNNYKLVVQVLSNEVLFSELIKQITATIPAKSNLTGFTINKAQGAIDISAIATDYTTATQVQINLADPANKIFSKADIVNVGCSTNENSNSIYPCTVSIHALFAPNNPFLFIASKTPKTTAPTTPTTRAVKP
jgi:Tfp pilus assembly protein PilN